MLFKLSFVVILVAVLWYYTAHYTDLKGMVPAFSVDRTFYEQDVPDLSGKTIFITGANTGLGFSSAKIVARKGAKTILGCRSANKCTKAAEKIRELIPNADVSTHILNLGSLADVQRSAEELLSSEQNIDMLMLNAGVMVPPQTITEDGLELQFGVNHVAHAYFTLKVLPLIQQTANAHGAATITVVSSFAHKATPDFVAPSGIIYDLDEMNREDNYNPQTYYGQSKLANVLFTQELSKRLGNGAQNIFVNSVHPGGVATELIRHVRDSVLAGVWDEIYSVIERVMMAPTWHPDEAALTQVYTAASPDIVSKKITGEYYTPLAQLHKPSHTGCTDEEGKKLWDFTDKILKDRGFTDYSQLEV